jgi:hypothetical protein
MKMILEKNKGRIMLTTSEETLIINEIATKLNIGADTYDDIKEILKGKIRDRASIWSKPNSEKYKEKLIQTMSRFALSSTDIIEETADYYRNKYKQENS